MTAWRRHWKIPAGLALLVAALVLLVGGWRVMAYVGSGGDIGGYTGGAAYENDLDLFDRSLIHTVELEIDETDLDAMIRLFQEDDGAKDWFPAEITIDGVTISEVGVRLKGFSTLRAALGTVVPPGESPSGEVDVDKLPLLVRLDEFNSGVSYQGITEIALRTEGPSEDDTLLEEIVSVGVLEAIGLDAPRVVYTSMSVNGRDATLRIIAENPTDEYADRLLAGAEGVLYKAQSSGTFRYLGHDPLAYVGVFEQESAINSLDLDPLMDFVQFVETSSDEEFAAGLADWLDVVAFADYLAVHNMLVNFDSLAGTNHNFYLLYDLDAGKMTVLSWDMNESFGGFWHTGGESWTLQPDWSNTGGIGGPPGNGPAGPGGGAPQGALRPEGNRPAPPDGEQGEGVQAPLPAGGAPPGAPPGGVDGGGLRMRDNVLLERFLEVGRFAALYEDRYSALYGRLYESGLVFDVLEQSARLLRQAVDLGLLTDREVRVGVGQKADWIRSRISFLEGLGYG